MLASTAGRNDMSTTMSDREHPLDRVYRALQNQGCGPQWIDGGRAILATCPCCGEPDSLVVQRTDREARIEA